MMLVLIAVSCSIAFAETGKEKLLIINPGQGNPRNSEGDVIELKDGRLCLIYTRFRGQSSHDNSAADLMMRTSDDNGKTWSDDSIVVSNKDGLNNVMSVSLLRLQNGDIALFYLRKTAKSDCRPLMRISKDEAKTWSDSIACITDVVDYYVLNNDRAIQLKSGRLLLPVALHHNSDWMGQIMCYLSDDNGKTWRRSKDVFKGFSPDGKRIHVQEPGVVELAGGELLMFCRTAASCQYFSRSTDGGETWSKLVPSTLISPLLSPASIERLPGTNKLVCVWNDHSGDHPCPTGQSRWSRTPLCSAISEDNGRTWSTSRMIEDKSDGCYCYVSMTFQDDRVILSSCAGDS